jgi:hypothetical protein
MALVVDRYAQAHLNFNWDDFVLGEVTELEEWPMSRGFSKMFAKLRYASRNALADGARRLYPVNSPKHGPQLLKLRFGPTAPAGIA